MPSLANMRTKAREAGLMKLDKLIAKRRHIPANGFPIPLKELCERLEKLYTGCVNDVMREACLMDQNLQSDIMPLRDEMAVCGEAFTVKSAPNRDIDGVLCIPREIAYEVLLRAEGVGKNEVDIFSWVHQGDTISEIIDKGGYF